VRLRRGGVMLKQAVILVGGLGTRLGEMARLVPKPLLEVAGKPFLDYILDEL
jgi:NDP-sugar pyrophosphorylase family protein